MPSGHTERDTINARRPLTPNMVDLLDTLERRARMEPPAHAVLTHREMTQAEKNAAKSLRVRGMVDFNIDFGGYLITAAGRAARTYGQEGK